MKRWLFNGFLAVATIGMLIRGGAALGFWQTPDFRGAAVHERECLDQTRFIGSTAESLGVIRADTVRYLTKERVRAAMRPFCEHYATDSRLRSRSAGEGRRAVSELIRSHPEVWNPMCKLGVEAEFATAGRVLRFMSAVERRRFQREECRYRRTYMAEDSPTVDLGRIAADHPEHYVPVCASGLQSSLSNERAAGLYTQKELHTIARRSCLEGLRTGVLDATGPGGFAAVRVDERRWSLVVQRAARSVRAS